MYTIHFLALFCFAVSPSHAAIISGPVVNPSNGNSYYLLDSATWGESQVEAEALGGNLVTINNAAENAWVYQSFGSPSGTERHLWIGLNDRDDEGVFEWVSGQPVTYVNWDQNEPNSFGEEDVVHIWADADVYRINFGSWNDFESDLSILRGIEFFGVVEIETTSVPEPSSFVLLSMFCVAIIAAIRFRRTCTK